MLFKFHFVRWDFGSPKLSPFLFYTNQTHLGTKTWREFGRSRIREWKSQDLSGSTSVCCKFQVFQWFSTQQFNQNDGIEHTSNLTDLWTHGSTMTGGKNQGPHDQVRILGSYRTRKQRTLVTREEIEIKEPGLKLRNGNEHIGMTCFLIYLELNFLVMIH